MWWLCPHIWARAQEGWGQRDEEELAVVVKIRIKTLFILKPGWCLKSWAQKPLQKFLLTPHGYESDLLKERLTRQLIRNLPLLCPPSHPSPFLLLWVSIWSFPCPGALHFPQPSRTSRILPETEFAFSSFSSSSWKQNQWRWICGVQPLFPLSSLAKWKGKENAEVCSWGAETMRCKRNSLKQPNLKKKAKSDQEENHGAKNPNNSWGQSKFSTRRKKKICVCVRKREK